MKTGIYIRVSTEEQAKEGYSIKAQEEKLKDYVRIKGWELYKVYADEGISGKNITERPAINERLRDLISKKIDNVLVFKIDRLQHDKEDIIVGLKKLSYDEAIRVARELGYSSVESFKGEYVEEHDISKYDLSQDINTKEIFLTRKQGAGDPAPTGQYRR